MDYSESIKSSIDFIQENIKDELTVKMLADRAGYSIFHYSRIFQLFTGMSVMEFIRKNRLTLAANELFEGRRIIDIALDYGFETQSGFTKAFRKLYGFSPGRYLAVMGYRNINPSKINYENGGLIMNQIIIKKPAFKIAGYGIRTNITNGCNTKDVAAFWSKYNINGWEQKLYELLEPTKHGEVGIAIPDKDDEGSLTYVLGVIIDDFSKTFEDMIKVDVPEATYAVFTTPPIDFTEDSSLFTNAINSTWKFIFESWFKDSGYEYDQCKYDFEFYDERCHPETGIVMDIYVPVIKK